MRIRMPELWAKLTSTPSAPPAGYVAVYAKSDDKVYRQTSGGVETELGAGSSGNSRTFAFFMG